jgi:5'-nucleotidase
VTLYYCVELLHETLVSNDDGIYALGIRSLANGMAEAGHEVTVVCPDRERSATGHGLTLHSPIRAEEVESVFHPSIKAWAVPVPLPTASSSP